MQYEYATMHLMTESTQMLQNKIGVTLMRQNPIHHLGVSAHCH